MTNVPFDIENAFKCGESFEYDSSLLSTLTPKPCSLEGLVVLSEQEQAATGFVYRTT